MIWSHDSAWCCEQGGRCSWRGVVCLLYIRDILSRASVAIFPWRSWNADFQSVAPHFTEECGSRGNGLKSRLWALHCEYFSREEVRLALHFGNVLFLIHYSLILSNAGFVLIKFGKTMKDQRYYFLCVNVLGLWGWVGVGEHALDRKIVAIAERNFESRAWMTRHSFSSVWWIQFW